MSIWWHGVSVGIWLLLSFFLSGMEAGVQALSPLRIRQWMREGRPGAGLLNGYLQRPENFLWTILVGNTLANFVAVTLLVFDLQMLAAGRAWAFWLGFAGVCAGLYVFGDLLPKILFRRFPNRLCLQLVFPFRLVHFALAPLVGVAERFARFLLWLTRGSAFTGRLFGNRDEFRALMQDSEGTLTSTERTLINRVLDLQNVTLARLAHPLESAATVTVDTPVAQVIELCRSRDLNRVPVWQGAGTRRRIVGVVRLTDLLYRAEPAGGTAAQHLRPALFLDEGLPFDAALRKLQRGGDQFAIVVGPDGRERGLVTLWDLLRTMCGDGRSAPATASASPAAAISPGGVNPGSRS
jgi:putative hemolysin